MVVLGHGRKGGGYRNREGCNAIGQVQFLYKRKDNEGEKEPM